MKRIPRSAASHADLYAVRGVRTDASSGGLLPLNAVDLILSHVQDAVFATDLANRVTYWADSAERLFGYTSEEAVGRSFGDLMSFQIADADGERGLLRAMKTGQTWHGAGSVRRRDGSEVWLESTVSPIVVGGKSIGGVSVSRDVTAAMATRDELAAEKRMVDAVLDAVGAPVIVLDADGAIVRFNGACERISGYPKDAVVGRPYWDALVPPVDAEAVQHAFTEIVTGIGGGRLANRWAARDGSRPLVGLAATTLTDPHGTVTHVICTGIDDAGQHPAIRDGLTGLLDRRQVDAGLELIVARYQREVAGAQPLSAVIFDLDDFGRLNNDHGRQAGDAVLCAFAEILRSRFRASDLVGRYSGDEFIAVMEGATPADVALVADEVREELESRTILGPNGEQLRAMVSAGCAAFDPTEPTPEAFLRAAEHALAMAKQAGRNQVVAA